MSEHSGVRSVWEENECLSSSDLGVHVARVCCPGWVHPQFLQGIDGKSLQVRGQHFEEVSGHKPPSESMPCQAQGSTTHFCVGQRALKVQTGSGCSLWSGFLGRSFSLELFAEFRRRRGILRGKLPWNLRIPWIGFNSREGEWAGEHRQISRHPSWLLDSLPQFLLAGSSCPSLFPFFLSWPWLPFV